jgi:hypothetical protein
MNISLSATLTGAIGTGVATIVGFWIAHYWRSRNAKDNFLTFMSQKRGAIPKRDAGDFYTTTKTEIRDVVFKLRPFLTPAKVVLLDRLWSEYNEISHEELAPENEAAWRIAFAKRFEHEFQSPSEILTFYMDEFCKIAR